MIKEKENGIGSAIFVSDNNLLDASAQELQSSIESLESSSPAKFHTENKRRYCVVSDMLYDLSMSSDVMKMVLGLKASGWTILFGDPGRQYARMNPGSMGNLLVEYHLPKNVAIQNNGLVSTCVYELT